MTRPARHTVYRACITLYPPAFRHHYGEDLVQHFDDLVVDRGVRAASFRVALDLVVTVPAYRLERIMSQQRSATAMGIIITLIAAGGVFGLLTDNASPGALLLLVAAVLAGAQRSLLARAVRTPVAGLRRRRLSTSAALAGLFVVCQAAYFALVGDTWTTRETLFVVVGTSALVGALIFFVVGLFTPKVGPQLVS